MVMESGTSSSSSSRSASSASSDSINRRRQIRWLAVLLVLLVLISTTTVVSTTSSSQRRKNNKFNGRQLQLDGNGGLVWYNVSATTSSTSVMSSLIITGKKSNSFKATARMKKKKMNIDEGFRKPVSSRILHSFSGHVANGNVCGILGGSGSG